VLGVAKMNWTRVGWENKGWSSTSTVTQPKRSARTKPRQKTTVQAQYPGVCPLCGKRYYQGSWVRPLGDKFGHSKCVRKRPPGQGGLGREGTCPSCGGGMYRDMPHECATGKRRKDTRMFL
jgi:hypothetical protein